MKTRMWKMAGNLSHGLELHYRCDDGELCWEHEDQLVAGGEHVIATMGRQCVAKAFDATVNGRGVVLVIAPQGEMVLLESDVEPRVIAGFLASVSQQPGWLSRPH